MEGFFQGPESASPIISQKVFMLVHIGYHKTGSSWFQKEIFNRTDRGFSPPFINGKAASKKLGAYFIQWLPFQFDADSMREYLACQVSYSTGMPVISNERLSGSAHSGGYDVKAIADRLKAVIPEAKILIGIREQVDMIFSCYQAYLKGGGGNTLKNYLFPPRVGGPFQFFSFEYFKYDRLIRYYQRLFGRGNVMVYPYEMFRKNLNELLSQLAGFCGVNIPSGLPVGTRHNINDQKFIRTHTRLLGPLIVSEPKNAFSPYGLFKGLRGVRVLTAFRGTVNRFIPQVLNEKCESRQKAYIKNRVKDMYSRSNARTSELIGIDLGEYGYDMA